MKSCTICKNAKPLDCFYKGRNQCKPCAVSTVRQWRDKNAEKCRKYLGKYKRALRPKVAAQSKQYRQRPETRQLIRVYNANRRALERAAEGSYTPDDVSLLMVWQRGLCALCLVDIANKPYHIDHIIPLAKGGSNWPWNIQLLCPTCNLRKGSLITTALGRLED